MEKVTFDMDFGKYDAERGRQAPEPGKYIFRITKTTELKEQQKGPNTGSLCFSAWCEALDGSELSGRGVSKFIGFGTNKDDYGRTQMGEWIALAEDLKRTDILQNGANAGPEDLIDTEFEAEVKVSAKGNPYLVKIAGISQEDQVEEDVEEENEPEDETPPPRAAGRKGRR